MLSSLLVCEKRYEKTIIFLIHSFQNSFQDVVLHRLKFQNCSYENDSFINIMQIVKRKPDLLLSLQHFCQKLYEYHNVLYIAEI